MKSYTPSSIKRRGTGRSQDPYLNRLPPEDKAVCSRCHAIYHNKHWALGESEAKTLLKNGASLTLCPACQKIRDHFPSGMVRLGGDYLKEHKGEILNLVRNEEERARGFNPLERIMSIQADNGSILITTTTEKLAQRIGNRLHRSHRGKVHYQWDNEHFIRVEWRRNLEE